MLLTSSDGASVELRPVGYQFAAEPGEPGEPGDWDANWLEIRGQVRTAAGESWTFEEPCLTTWEARQLGDWLRSAAEGRVPVAEAPTEDAAGVLTFTESNLAFSLAARDGDDVALRIHLALESARPESDEATTSDVSANGVPLRIERRHLLAAAGAWEEELAPFPER